MLNTKNMVFKERLVKKLIEITYKAIYSWEDNIKKYSEDKATNLYENISSGEHSYKI